MQANSREMRRIFEGDRRYLVPLFQRPYVWTHEEQWVPLWDDIRSLAERLGTAEDEEIAPHFMGAIVLDQPFNATGDIEARLVIDGQQRLTTMQILLEVVLDIAYAREHKRAATLERLARNAEDVCERPEYRYKVWPTNVDQPIYRKVMDATDPADMLRRLELNPSRKWADKPIADCYLFFHRTISEWLDEAEGEDPADRLENLYRGLTQHMRIVIIDLESQDDAQLIFETLNARGTPLLPADLIKNLLFNEARQQEERLDLLYEETWQQFDADNQFWRAEIGRGHARRAQIDLFLQNYLSAVSDREIPVTHLYAEFVRTSRQSPLSAREKLGEVIDYAQLYKRFSELDETTREGVFRQRLEDMEVRVLHPFLLELLRHHANDRDCVRTVLRDLESFLVRRLVCQLNTRGYGRFFLDLVPVARMSADKVPDLVKEKLLASSATTGRWPDDDEFRDAWMSKPAYENLARARVRMILHALAQPDPRFDEIGTLRRGLTIEHLLPQTWGEADWPLPESIDPDTAAAERGKILHTMGNLTLVTQPLNSQMANRSWSAKRGALAEHTSIVLNRKLVHHEAWQERWDETTIAERGAELFEAARQIWPHPGTPARADATIPELSSSEQQESEAMTSDQSGSPQEASAMDLSEKTDDELTNLIENHERKGATDKPLYRTAVEERARRSNKVLDFDKSLEHLIDVAQRNVFTTYGDLAAANDVPWKTARHLMNGINGHLDQLLDLCHVRGLPLLPAICVNQEGVQSGTLAPSALKGFMEGCRRLGYEIDDSQAESFLRAQQEKCFAWGRDQ